MTGVIPVAELISDEIIDISDTHLGYEHRKRQDSGDRVSWFSEVDTKNQLRKAINIIREQEADAVIHTGDIFDHNPDTSDIDFFGGILRELDSHDIPAYIIIGNHDYLSQSVLDNIETWERDGLLTVCSRSGDNIADALDIYGIHCDDIGLEGPQPGVKLGWDEEEQQFGQPSTGGLNILCLHESVHPPVKEGKADISLSILLNSSNVEFDLVLVGHEHSPPWSDCFDDISIQYASLTVRISDHFEDADPFVNHLNISGDDKPVISQKNLL